MVFKRLSHLFHLTIWLKEYTRALLQRSDAILNTGYDTKHDMVEGLVDEAQGFDQIQLFCFSLHFRCDGFCIICALLRIEDDFLFRSFFFVLFPRFFTLTAQKRLPGAQQLGMLLTLVLGHWPTVEYVFLICTKLSQSLVECTTEHFICVEGVLPSSVALNSGLSKMSEDLWFNKVM